MIELLSIEKLSDLYKNVWGIQEALSQVIDKVWKINDQQFVAKTFPYYVSKF